MDSIIVSFGVMGSWARYLNESFRWFFAYAKLWDGLGLLTTGDPASELALLQYLSFMNVF